MHAPPVCTLCAAAAAAAVYVLTTQPIWTQKINYYYYS